MSVYLFIMFPIRDCERSELTSAGCREVSQTTIYTTIVRLIVRLLYEVSRFFLLLTCQSITIGQQRKLVSVRVTYDNNTSCK